MSGDYSLDGRYFHNLQDDEQERILNYPLQVYVCEGSASEKLAWFRIINIAGERLTGQELRNAVYAGPWVFDAKRHFSRKGAACPAYAIGTRFVNGRAERQEYLETAIQWIKDEGQTVEEYMAAHQHDRTAIALWSHFQAVVNRVEAVFPDYRTPMKGVDWGGLYGQLKDESLDPEELEARRCPPDERRRCDEESGHLPVSSHWRGKASQHPSLLRFHEAEGVRDAKWHLWVMREGIRDVADGRRPHHPLVGGWQDNLPKLSNAAQGLQSQEIQQMSTGIQI